MAEDFINFQLDHPHNTGRLTYRPFGVCTIKLKISSETQAQPALRLRPKRQTPADLTEGTFRGFPDDTDALMLSWGGGHEPGPCVKPKDFLHFREDPVPLPAGETSYIYFNLTHIQPDTLPDSASLTLEAFQPGDANRPDTLVSTLTLTLHKPAAIPDQLRLVEPIPDRSDVWQISAGTHLNAYDPRWWPEGVSYTAESAPLPLTIHRQENRLELLWNGAAEPLAILTDNTEPSLLTPGSHRSDYRNTLLLELFNFDDHHLALRVWFHWLNKKIGGKLFLGRHEVPDAERFDFILRKDSGSPVFVCTDLHWSEMWGEVPQLPLHVSLGLSREKILSELKKKMPIPSRWLGLAQDDPQPVNEATESHNPIAFIRSRAAARYRKESLNQVRDKGSEAHVPQLHGVIEYHQSRFGASKRNQMVSNDVRLVF